MSEKRVSEPFLMNFGDSESGPQAEEEESALTAERNSSQRIGGKEGDGWSAK